MKSPTRHPAFTVARPDRLRRIGHRGREILPHRAIHRLRSPWRALASGGGLALLFSAGLLALQPTIADAWAATLTWWLEAMALPGLGVAAVAGTGTWLAPAVPAVEVPSLPLHGWLPLLHAAVIAACWWAAGRLPDAARPGAYLLRFAVLIHAIAVMYFWLWPASFPYSAADHTENGLRQNWALMLLTPWIHLGTYYLFPFPRWQSLALTALTLLYLAALAPLQYALHAVLMYHLGLVAMPLLYLLFGVTLSILGFVALYGWAMSWQAPMSDGRGA
jgi:hypothetical protein